VGIKKAISSLVLINLVGAGLGLVTAVLIARLFGTTAEAAVYFGATSLFAVTFSLSQTGQLVEVFLPVYHQRKAIDGPRGAYAAASVVINWMVLAFGLLAVGAALAAPQLVRLLLPGFSEASQLLGVQVFRAISPLLALRSLLSVLHSVGNAERHFGVPESVAVVSQAFSITAIAILASPLGVWALVVALWVGELVRLVGFILFLHKIGFRYTGKLAADGFDHGAVFRQAAVTIWYVLATQVWVFALNAALSLLSESVFALYKHAEAIYRRTNGLLMRPISVVYFTEFAQIAPRSRDAVWDSCAEAVHQTLALAALVLVGIAISSRPLLSILWGSESFTPQEIGMASTILIALFGLLTFSGPGQVLRKAVVSAGFLRIQYVGLTGIQLASAASAGVLVAWLGVWGAVTAVFLNALGFLLVPLLIARVKAGRLVFYRVRAALTWTGSALLGGAAGVAAMRLAQKAELSAVWEGVAAAGAASGAVAVVLLTAVILKDPVARDWLGAARRQVRRRT